MKGKMYMIDKEYANDKKIYANIKKYTKVKI